MVAKKYLYLKEKNEYLKDEGLSSAISVDLELSYTESLYRRIDAIVNEYSIDTVIAKKKYIYYAARLLWNNDNIVRYILIDTDNAVLNEEQNLKAIKIMWDNVAVKNWNSENPIRLSGWKRSDIDTFFSDKEMREFADNVYRKIENIVSSKDKVLEIGVASGISCYAIAPLVRNYYGVDLSKEVLFFTDQYLKKNNIHNVTLFNCEAIEINKLDIPQVKLVLLNSIIQYFPGYNYFIDVLQKSILKIDHKGYIFIGDILDLDLYEQYRTFRGLNNIVYDREQYYSKNFFRKLPQYFCQIRRVEISNKLGQIENELNVFRYDVLLEIDNDTLKSPTVVKARYADSFWDEGKLVSLKQIISAIEEKNYDFMHRNIVGNA